MYRPRPAPPRRLARQNCRNTRGASSGAWLLGGVGVVTEVGELSHIAEHDTVGRHRGTRQFFIFERGQQGHLQSMLPTPESRDSFKVLDSQGTYFLNVDLPASGIGEADRAFALRTVKEAGVASIPVSARPAGG